jgi:hypothetical protein
MMQSKKLILVTLFIVLIVVAALFIQPWINSGVQAKSFLEDAQAHILSPGPNDVVHYSYEIYRRPPPDGTEPIDPYHKPYSEIWRSTQREDTWIEIGPDGFLKRWRVQLRDSNGILLQDLLFDGTNETDYFVDEGKAVMFPGETSLFRDERIVLIEDFLQNSRLSRKDNIGVHGLPVISIYAPSQPLKNGPTVNTALSNFLSPFAADLRPVSQALRIDFDPLTNLPVATVNVIRDQEGIENVISYRTLPSPEILILTPADTDELFRQDIPLEAFINSGKGNQENVYLTDLKEIAQKVDYVLFAASMQGMQLDSASLALPQADAESPAVTNGMAHILSSGAGVQMIYINKDTGARINLIQGKAEDLSPVLKIVPPAWTFAEQKTVSIGDIAASGWYMESDAGTRIYIIEIDNTLLYVEAVELNQTDCEIFLQTLEPVQ